MQILQDLNRNEGVSTVVVTHNPSSAEFADETIHMSDGNIVEWSK
jgi:putative ABC transport system ATP-binding protein